MLKKLSHSLLLSAFVAVAAFGNEAGEHTTDSNPAASVDPNGPMPETDYKLAQAEIADEPNLPRVLLIGDSISIGYTLPTRALLKGEANVHRPGINCASTIRGVQGLQGWLGDKKWDVIHFNWGLHDMAREKGAYKVPPDQYEKNLREIVGVLKGTGATLIWASTTPVPDTNNPNARSPADVLEYNAIAEKIMKENGIRTDDLYTFMLPQTSGLQLKNNVHFTVNGSKALAGQVTQSIREALKEKAK